MGWLYGTYQPRPGSWQEVLLPEWGHTGKGFTSWILLLMAGFPGLHLRKCFETTSSLSSEQQSDVQVSSPRHLLMLCIEARCLRVYPGNVTQHIRTALPCSFRTRA